MDFSIEDSKDLVFLVLIPGESLWMGATWGLENQAPRTNNGLRRVRLRKVPCRERLAVVYSYSRLNLQAHRGSSGIRRLGCFDQGPLLRVPLFGAVAYPRNTSIVLPGGRYGIEIRYDQIDAIVPTKTPPAGRRLRVSLPIRSQ